MQRTIYAYYITVFIYYRYIYGVILVRIALSWIESKSIFAIGINNSYRFFNKFLFASIKYLNSYYGTKQSFIGQSIWNEVRTASLIVDLKEDFWIALETILYIGSRDLQAIFVNIICGCDNFVAESYFIANTICIASGLLPISRNWLSLQGKGYILSSTIFSNIESSSGRFFICQRNSYSIFPWNEIVFCVSSQILVIQSVRTNSIVPNNDQIVSFEIRFLWLAVDRNIIFMFSIDNVTYAKGRFTVGQINIVTVDCIAILIGNFKLNCIAEVSVGIIIFPMIISTSHYIATIFNSGDIRCSKLSANNTDGVGYITASNVNVAIYRILHLKGKIEFTSIRCGGFRFCKYDVRTICFHGNFSAVDWLIIFIKNFTDKIHRIGTIDGEIHIREIQCYNLFINRQIALIGALILVESHAISSNVRRNGDNSLTFFCSQRAIGAYISNSSRIRRNACMNRVGTSLSKAYIVYFTII